MWIVFFRERGVGTEEGKEQGHQHREDTGSSLAFIQRFQVWVDIRERKWGGRERWERKKEGGGREVDEFSELESTEFEFDSGSDTPRRAHARLGPS